MSETQVAWLTDLTRELMRSDDTGIVLDHILLEARRVSQADAGTVYLVEGDELVFAYTHNDTLFPVETAYKYAYADARLPIAQTSIAGYCAYTRKAINLHDVRNLPAGMPFTFNDAFDRTTGYRTVSVLTLPLVGREGREGRILGVLQLINALGPNGPQPFDRQTEHLLGFLAVQAVSALERSMLAREMILRIQKIAALSDPDETGPHAERVGAVAAEIYQRWAEGRSIPVDTRRAFRGQIRLAAMLHDVGKIVIPREVLKKPGRLTPEEFEIIKTHCAEGARLIGAAVLYVSSMAHDIALHHHQRWDGKGYTGDPNVPQRSGEDIPLAARVTAVADVFDALVSPRCYKPAWSWDEAQALLVRDSGAHFDAEVVQAFIQARDVIAQVYARYPD